MRKIFLATALVVTSATAAAANQTSHTTPAAPAAPAAPQSMAALPADAMDAATKNNLCVMGSGVYSIGAVVDIRGTLHTCSYRKHSNQFPDGPYWKPL